MPAKNRLKKITFRALSSLKRKLMRKYTRFLISCLVLQFCDVLTYFYDFACLSILIFCNIGKHVVTMSLICYIG